MSSQVATRFKTSLKLVVQRLRNTAAKKEALNKKERRSIASLLEKGKIETARVVSRLESQPEPRESKAMTASCDDPQRVETIVNEEIYIELLEVLELFAELCIARFGLIEQSREVDPNIAEAVSGLLYASPKTDIKELHQLSTLFLQHYGREYAVKCIENQDNIVSARVTQKLIIHTPAPQLVDAYLFEIAKAYSVDWRPDEDVPASTSENGTADQNLKGISLEERETVGSLPNAPPTVPSEADQTVSIHASLPPQPHLVSSAAAGPSVPAQTDARSTENAGHTLKPVTTEATAVENQAKTKEDQEFDALKRRFEALKKR